MSRAQNLFLLHFIILLFGFTGILGKLITLDSFSLVWYRMVVAALALLIYLIAKGRLAEITRGPLLKMLGLGVVVAAHWLTFFEAIKISNVSVALATMSTAALFVALFTPLFKKVKYRRYEIILGLMAVLGLVLIFGFETEHLGGIVLALISSALVAIFTLGNSELLKRNSPTSISTLELLSGSFVLTIYLLLTDKMGASFWAISGMDWMWLLLLSVVATSFAFVASIEVMKQLSPFTVAITVNLEPIYSILLALWIFGEDEKMSAGFYVGAAIILSTIFINARIKVSNKSKYIAKIKTPNC